MTFRKFESIGQFSNTVKDVRHYCNVNHKPLPKLKFKGSVKLHGTNACISSIGASIFFQSRERILSLEEDNAGFCKWGLDNIYALNKIVYLIRGKYKAQNVYIYGEWCGQGIQKGTALNQLAGKYFAIFEIVAINLEGNEFNIDPIQFASDFKNILDNVLVIDDVVPPLEVLIDFAAPHLVQNFLLEKTLEVETECPFGKALGFSGVGEGLVWSCELPEIGKFKTKGEKHSSSKVKTVRELTEAEISQKESVADFVEYAVSENRLNQGVSKLEEMCLPFDVKSTGAFLKWLGGDVLNECSDVLEKSGLEKKDVMPSVNLKAKQWFLNKLNESIFK